jgi:hypothetical protein
MCRFWATTQVKLVYPEKDGKHIKKEIKKEKCHKKNGEQG